MKKSVTFFIPLISILILLSLSLTLIGFQPKQSLTAQSDSWEKLGETKINQTEASDEFNFPPNSPVLSAIKIKSKKGGINLLRCVVYFSNGDKKSIELRNDIQPGGESRIINLTGNQSRISKFVFWYGSPQSGDQKAELEFWGKI
jgi:hypothetical protein